MRLLAWLYNFCSCESCTDVSDFDLCILSNLAVFDKDYESLDSGNSVTFSARLCDLYVVFFSCFYWFWTKASTAKAASASSTTKSSFTVGHYVCASRRRSNINASQSFTLHGNSAIVECLSHLYLARQSTVCMLNFKCRDVGFDCGFEAKGNTEGDILQACAAHAQRDHGMKPSDINEDLKNKIRSNIHKV